MPCLITLHHRVDPHTSRSKVGVTRLMLDSSRQLRQIAYSLAVFRNNIYSGRVPFWTKYMLPLI
jgi:hypothetical protein